MRFFLPAEQIPLPSMSLNLFSKLIGSVLPLLPVRAEEV
jgi:hypothetical protein